MREAPRAAARQHESHADILSWAPHQRTVACAPARSSAVGRPFLDYSERQLDGARRTVAPHFESQYVAVLAVEHPALQIGDRLDALTVDRDDDVAACGVGLLADAGLVGGAGEASLGRWAARRHVYHHYAVVRQRERLARLFGEVTDRQSG